MIPAYCQNAVRHAMKDEGALHIDIHVTRDDDVIFLYLLLMMVLMKRLLLAYLMVTPG